MKANIHSHFYLYAKGFYKKTNMIADLKKIIAHDYLLDVEHISDNDVKNLMLGVVFPENWELQTANWKIRDFFEDINPENFYKWSCEECDEWNYKWVVIRKCLSVLYNTKINEIDDEGYLVPIIILDDPDPNILPVL